MGNAFVQVTPHVHSLDKGRAINVLVLYNSWDVSALGPDKKVFFYVSNGLIIKILKIINISTLY